MPQKQRGKRVDCRWYNEPTILFVGVIVFILMIVYLSC